MLSTLYPMPRLSKKRVLKTWIEQPMNRTLVSQKKKKKCIKHWTLLYIFIYIYMRWVQVTPGVTPQELQLF